MGTFHRLSFIPSVSLTELKMLENVNKKTIRALGIIMLMIIIIIIMIIWRESRKL